MNKSIQEKYIETDSGRIYYYANRISSDRPTVVLLHGLSSNHTTWLGAVKSLQEADHNTIVPDLRGHGLSDKSKIKENYDFSFFSEDLSLILEAEKVKKVVLVGYCYGGEVAIDYILRFPENIQGLFLISVNHYRPLSYGYLDFFTPIVAGLLDFFALLLLWQGRKEYHYYNHGEAVGYWDSVWDGLRTMPVSVNFWMLANVFRVNFRGRIKDIKAPTLMVRGQKDAFVTKTEIKEMTAAIRNSKAFNSRNPNHFVGTNAQDEVIEFLLNFLKEL